MSNLLSGTPGPKTGQETPVERPEFEGPPHPPRIALGLVGYFITTAIVALIALSALELSQALRDPWLPAMERIAEIPIRLLLLGYLLLWLLLILVVSVVGRLWIASTLFLSLVGAAAMANYQKMRLRLEPIYPADVLYLGDLGFLAENAGVLASLGVGIGVALTGSIAFFLSRLSARIFGTRSLSGSAFGRRQLLLRGGAATLAGAVLISATNFNEPRNPVRQTYDAAGASWAPWDQPQNYALNGFTSGLLYNMPVTAMRKPEGYSAAAMDILVDKYSRIASSINAERRTVAIQDTNVILVLGESFVDPLRMEGVELEEDPIPFTRSLMASSTSGTMLSSGYGGGTANVEFEVLTGMTVHNFEPQISTPYQMLVPQYASFPSLLRSLAGQRHEKVAIHPFKPSLYRRTDVYSSFGFTRTKFLDQMTHTERYESDPFVSDAATFNELLDDIRASERPVVAKVVTMQNHRPLEGKYASPLNGWDAKGDPLPEELGQYLRGLRYSDLAIQQLSKDLQDLPERTVVLYYGDHHPAAWPDSVLDQNDPRTKFETPFFVFANFTTRRIETPEVLSPPFLVNQMLRAVNAPLTPYEALLEKLAEELPVLDRKSIDELSRTERTSPAKDLLSDYRLVQYDLSVGRRYSAEAMFDVVGHLRD
jgi:phosphoglycerol transferase MdoB-like AlkP superfamily enzyme